MRRLQQAGREMHLQEKIGSGKSAKEIAEYILKTFKESGRL